MLNLNEARFATLSTVVVLSTGASASTYTSIWRAVELPARSVVVRVTSEGPSASLTLTE